MHDSSVRRRAIVAAGLASTLLVAACEDKRVKELQTGITRDSAVKVIQQDLKPGLPSDSFPNVFTREQYLMGGKHYEVLYFTPDNDKARVVPSGIAPTAKDTIPFHKLTPLVFIDNHLAGRGWAYWDSVSKANKIPLKKH